MARTSRTTTEDVFNRTGDGIQRLRVLTKLASDAISAVHPDAPDALEQWELLTIFEMLTDIGNDLDAAFNDGIELDNAQYLAAKAAAAKGVQ